MRLRLLHMSDIHFGDEDDNALAAATEFAQATLFDLMVLTGDLTQFGHRDEFTATQRWLAQIPHPWLATPGNHDTPWLGLAERMTSPFGRYADAVGPAEQSAFDGDCLAVRTLNSARGWQFRLNWSKGKVSRDQAAGIAARFAGAPPAALRVLACHHPLIEEIGGPMTGRVRGGHHAAKKAQAANVDLVMNGHIHAPFVQALSYGDGMTYSVGAGTLSQRQRGAPPGFNVIEASGDELSVTSMAWDGRKLVVDRVWVLPLRPRIGGEG